MRIDGVFLGLALMLAGCGQQQAGAGGNAAEPARHKSKPKPKYCFFKEAETSDWRAARDAAGNVVVTGRAYRSDPRYKATIAEMEVAGTTATVRPSITINDTGYAAPGDWWDLKATVPGSATVTVARVECGQRTLATLDVKPH